MRDLQGLTFADFEKKGLIVLGKVEVDKSGGGQFEELEEVLDFNVSSNITNIFLKTCSNTFNVRLLNTDDKYSLFDKGKSKYNHIKQGRKIKLYVGINTEKTVEDTVYTDHETEVIVSDELGEITEYTSCGDPEYEGEWVYPVHSSHVGRCCMGYPNETSIRLTNIQIPQGVMIDNATLKIYMKGYYSCSGDNLGGNIIIKAEKIANSTRITSLEDYKTRVRTSAYTEENIAYPTYTVIETDITAIIQEITDQENWESGNAINLFLTPSGDFTLGDFVRIYDYLPETEKSLSVQYKTSNTVETTEQQDFYWSWLYGVVDKVNTSKNYQGEICSISGRDYLSYLAENYLINLWWGKNKKYTVIPDKEFYQMEDDCTGIYRAFIKIGEENYREIRINSEFTYDWDINQFVFLKPNVPDISGELWIYYFTAQIVENVVADLLIESKILNVSQKIAWLNSSYCEPTGIEVDRIYFTSGTNYLNAIEKLIQVAPYYRLYINQEGMPCFKPPPDLSNEVKTLKESEYMIKSIEERIDELYNHFIIEGEKREMRRNWISVTAYSEVKDLTSDSVTLQGAVTSKAEDTTVVRRGFIWQAEGQAEESWYETGNFELGYYSHTIIVEPDTNYKFRSVAMDNSWNTKKSPWQYFKTPESEMS